MLKIIMKTAVKLGIITSGTLLIALTLILGIMDVKDINVDLTKGTIQATAFGKPVTVSEENTSEISITEQATNLQTLNPKQLEKINQQLESVPQQTEEIQLLKNEVQSLREQLSEKPSQQTTYQIIESISSIYGSWDFSGSSVGYSIFGEIVFYDDQSYEIDGNLAGVLYYANGKYEFDRINGTLTLIDSFTGLASFYYITDIGPNSFSMSNPISAEYYSLNRL